ncbi:MAG: ribonuclease III [Clostridia bacterium]|nr:ribonuclease III [Clostridia bacterium]MBR2613932.1 ribonuclease III [Clostridia bacterium]
MQRSDISTLEERIGYSFKNKNILKEALTHSSYANELKARKQEAVCNERLEFLGDSVLSVVVSEYLFEKFSSNPEGELTQRRALLVQSASLAAYSRSIGLGDHLYLGHGEEKNRGRERQSTLENAFEALVAAIYLDAGENGLDEVRRFVLPIVDKYLEENYDYKHIDAKTELQQLIQQAEGDFLEYVVVAERGPDHKKEFEVVARLNSNIIGRGKGNSKREAEQNAAKEALKLFGTIE